MLCYDFDYYFLKGASMILKNLIDKEISLIEKWEESIKSTSLFCGIGSIITILCFLGYLFLFSSTNMAVYFKFFITLAGLNALAITLIPYLKLKKLKKVYNFYREQLVMLADTNSEKTDILSRIHYLFKHKFIKKEQIHDAINHKITDFELKTKKSVYKIVLHTLYILVVVIVLIHQIKYGDDFSILSLVIPVALIMYSFNSIIRLYQQKNNFYTLTCQWKHHLEKIQEKAYDAELVEILNDTLCNPEKIVVVE